MAKEKKVPSAYQEMQILSCFQALERNFNPETDEEALDVARGDVYEILNRVIRAALEADSFADAVDNRISVLQDRKKRYENRRDTLRATAFAVMDVLGLQKHAEADFTASVRVGSQKAVVVDEDAVPAEYKKTVVSVDKTAINQAVKDGVVVPGVEMSNGLPSLSIRTK